MLQNPRCVVNYHEIGIYRTSNYERIAAATTPNLHGYMTPAGFLQWNTKTLTSSNIQLSSIPEKIIVFARRVQSNLRCTDADQYLVIKDVRVNFNNNSALLASFTQEQLYDASVSSWLKNLTWEEFSGCTISAATRDQQAGTENTRARFNGWQRNAYSGVGAPAEHVGFKQIPTTGSILVLDFARQIHFRRSSIV